MKDIYRINKEQKIILGIGLPAFIHNGSYFSTSINIYEDNIIEVWGEHMDLNGIIDKIRSGWIVTSIPEGAELNHGGLFVGVSQKLGFYVEEEEFIKEIQDHLNVFKGDKCFSELCFIAFKKFITKPSEINQYALRKAYESVPKHKRMYLGSMEDKDTYVKYFINTKVEDVEQKHLEYCKNLYLDRKLTLLK